MKPEALIFDIDGTLWDSRQLVAEGYNAQLRSEGLAHLQTTAEALKPLFGKVLEEIADVLFASLPKEQRVPLINRCMEAEEKYLIQNPCHIGYPKVKETLEILKKDYRLFIVSNSMQGYPDLCICKLGLDDLIEAHLCYGDTGTTKGQTILRLMKEQNITSAMYVGDTAGDMEACQEAGIPFIFAAFGFGNPPYYDYKLEQFADLPALCRTLED